MNDKIAYIETKKRTYPIVFNLNVLEDLQDKYGSFQKWGEIVSNNIDGDESKDREPNIKDLKQGLMLMINEAIDMENEDKTEDEKEEFVNERQLGRIISEVGQDKILKSIMDLTVDSTQTDNNSKNV